MPALDNNEPEPTASVQEVNPAKAKELLANNKYNRKTNVRRVSRYAAMMGRRQFVFTGESIILNNGEILDGAHRLRAQIEAGVTMKWVIVENVNSEAFKYIDSGAGRNLSDSFFIQGLANYRLVAQAVNYLAGFTKYNRWTTNGVEIPDRWEIFEEYSELEDIVPLYAPRLGLQGCNKGILIAAHALFGRKEADLASEFMEAVTGDEDPPEDHPARAFRAWFKSQVVRVPMARDINAKTGNGLIRAWNAVRNNERLDRLRPPTTAPEIQ